MKPIRVAINESVSKKLRTLVKSVWFTETGGPMVGYVSDDATLIVTGVAGPGPKSKCRLFSVTIDGEHSQRFCDKAYVESEGAVDYVGDWHCHPSLSLTPSYDDEAAMEIMASTEGLTSTPVSIIYSRISHRMKAYVWDGDGLKPVPLEIVQGAR